MSLEEIDALLADLQSSVSGPTHSPGPRVHPPPSVSHHQSPTTAYAHSSPVSYTHRSPGPQPHHNGEFRHNPDSITHYANGDVDTNPQKKVYYQESKEEVRTESRSSGPNPAPEPKTDELESLLSELNSSRYTGIVDRSSGAMAQPASAGRPSVDYLLNELNSVNSTSRTTTSQNHMPSNHMPSNPPLAASTATRDLDDLMAELSDIKEDRSWVSALEDQVESEDHPERVGATTAQSSQKTAMSTFQSTKTSQSSTSKTTKGSSKSSHGLAFKAMQDSGFKSPQGSKSPKPPRTPPPRPPTPRNVATPPPRPPAPADIGAPLVLPCPDTPPPIPPPPAAINASPTTTLNRKTPVVAEPFERPDSGGPVKRNDAAYRWITDEIKYEIRAVQDEPEEEPPIIPEPVS